MNKFFYFHFLSKKTDGEIFLLLLPNVLLNLSKWKKIFNWLVNLF